MDLILLGGRNLNQQQWIREVERELAPHFAATHVLDYQHWKRGVVEEDVVGEAENLAALVDSLQGEYAIFGKSMGTLVAAETIRQGRITPQYCIFVGVPFKFPLSHHDNEARLSYFAGYETPTLVVQNPDEKYMRPKQVRETFDRLKIKNCDVITGTGGIHSYDATSLPLFVCNYVDSRVGVR